MTTLLLIGHGSSPTSGLDEEMRAHVANNLEGRGTKCHPHANIVKLEKVAGGIKATFDKGEEYETDAVMFAVGRKPTTKKIGLKNVGVDLEKVGAKYNVTNRINLTPVANMEAMCFAKTESAGNPDFVNVASAVYCQPPLSIVAVKQAVKQAENIIYWRKEKTLMKLIVDVAMDKVLGAADLGPDAAEIIQGVAIALKCGATKAQFDATVGIHPTPAEELVTMRKATRRVTFKGEVFKV